YADRFRFIDFNHIYRGNSELEDQRYHDFSLAYQNFNMGKGMIYYAGISYSKQERSIQRATQVEGIDQINTSIYSKHPENTYKLNGRFSQNKGDYRFVIGGVLSFSDYSRLINEEVY